MMSPLQVLIVAQFLDILAMEDDVGSRRRQLILRGEALVCVICAWMTVRFRRLANSRPAITYGPLSAREEERQNNLRFIYHSKDI